MFFSALGRAIERFSVSTLPSLVRSLTGRLKARRKKRLAIVALSGLSTEALNDIGITAGDVAVVASGLITLAELNEIRRSGWPY